jgi:DNA-binding NtrC family response regulator
VTSKNQPATVGNPSPELGSILRAQVRNVVERIRPCVLTDGDEVEFVDVVGNRAGIRLSGRYVGFPSAKLTLELIIAHETDVKVLSMPLDDRLREVEISLIRWALKVCSGNKSRAAKLLKMKRSTLADRLKRLNL